MRSYTLNQYERAMTGGFTDLYVLKKDDWVPNDTTTYTLCDLNPGDAVYRVLMETKTYLAGPATGTLSVGLDSDPDSMIDDSDIKSAADKYVVKGNPEAVLQAAGSLVANAILGAGAATAGEVWIWATISRAADRNVKG
jgi:hypothetical protein